MRPAPRYDRPDATEYAEPYAAYIGMVPRGEADVMQVLEGQIDELARLLAGVPQSRGDYAYAPGKWTLKEVLSHVADSERVFSYRALSIGRGDSNPLPGFDEKAWTPASGANQRTVADLVEELKIGRAHV